MVEVRTFRSTQAGLTTFAPDRARVAVPSTSRVQAFELWGTGGPRQAGARYPDTKCGVVSPGVVFARCARDLQAPARQPAFRAVAGRACRCARRDQRATERRQGDSGQALLHGR